MSFLNLSEYCKLLQTGNQMVGLVSRWTSITNLFQCLPVIENLTLCCKIIKVILSTFYMIILTRRKKLYFILISCFVYGSSLYL